MYRIKDVFYVLTYQDDLIEDITLSGALISFRMPRCAVCSPCMKEPSVKRKRGILLLVFYQSYNQGGPGTEEVWPVQPIYLP